jgi:uncharacterized protein YqkB
MVGLAWGAGVPTLLFVASIDEKADLILFNDELKIDYSDSANSFQLKSPQQFVNGRMAFISSVK